MNISRLIAISMVATLVGAIAFAPTRAIEAPLNDWLKKSNAGSFRADAGSLWFGQGTLTLSLQGGGSLPVRLSWQIHPSALLRLRVGVALQAKSPQLQVTARLAAGFSDLAVQEAKVTTTLETLLRIAPATAALTLFQPSAGVVISGGDGGLMIGYSTPNRIDGDINVLTENLTLRSLMPGSLTSFTTRFAFKESHGEFKLLNATGSIKLDGGGRLSLVPRAPNGRREFSYSGLMTPAADLPPELRARLTALGRPDPDGRVRVEFKTDF